VQRFIPLWQLEHFMLGSLACESQVVLQVRFVEMPTRQWVGEVAGDTMRKSNKLPLPVGCPQPPHPIDEDEAAIWIRMAPKWWRAGLLDDLTSSMFEQLVHVIVSYLEVQRRAGEGIIAAGLTEQQRATAETALAELGRLREQERREAAEWRRLARLFAADCGLLTGGRENLALLDETGEDAELKRILELG
jgi:hypothetical protein